MSAGPDWLYALVFLAGACLMGAIEVTGIIICLRRWHLGTAARLGAIGFGLMLSQTVISQLFQFVQSYLFHGDSTRAFQIMAVYSSAMVVLSGAGTLLVMLALRQALSDFARSRSVLQPDDETCRGLR